MARAPRPTVSSVCLKPNLILFYVCGNVKNLEMLWSNAMFPRKESGGIVPQNVPKREREVS